MKKFKEYIDIIKKIWSNKRYRALFVLILYVIFNALIISSYKANRYKEYKEPQKIDDESIYYQEIKILLDNKTLIINSIQGTNKYVVLSDNIFNLENGAELTEDNLESWLRYIFKLKDSDVNNYLDKAIKINEERYTASMKKNNYELNINNIAEVDHDCVILISEYVDDDTRIKIDADASNCREYIDRNINKLTLSIEYKLKN